jgi:metal-responsive CopG/Arc/MetJ family transcriptional regulator
MRVHIDVDEALLKKIDEVAGPRGRSRFVRQAVEQALEWEERWKLIRSARGAIADYGHEWDDDPAEWVREQRRADPRRVG